MTMLHRRLILACICLTLLSGCTFQGAILNDATVRLKAIEIRYPSGKRITFHEVEPLRLKTFQASQPTGDVKIWWQESAEGTGQTYGVTLPPERIKAALQAPNTMLVLRITNDHGPHLVMYGVRTREFQQSLLQSRGDAFRAVVVQP